MAPNTLGPAIQIEDTLTRRNEIVLIKLPVEISLGDTTSTWSGSRGQGLGYAHPCIILSMEYIGETSKVRIELIWHAAIRDRQHTCKSRSIYVY